MRSLIALGLVASAVALTPTLSQGAPSDVVLGAEELAPNGAGFGTAEPNRIFNGGVPSGLVKKIRWKSWGSPTAKGKGRGFQYKPEGGYYSRTVKVDLRAKRIGQCPGHSKRAYTVLRARVQNKPGGHFGRWFSWSGAETICSF